jgi:signal transduction histidine kinase/CheY-like chemotaxis protein
MNQTTRSALAECLEARQTLIPRLAGCVFVLGLTLAQLLGWVPLAVVAGWITIQLCQRAWTARRLARGELEVHAGHGAAFMLVSASMLAGLAVYALASARPWAMVAGGFILASGLLFASATTGRSRIASLVILAPNLLGLAILPLVAWRREASGPETLNIALGMVLLAGAALAGRQQAHRALEAEHRANLSKSEFLATISHEIRTPLNGVLGMAQAMAFDELSPAQRERLEAISQSGEALLMLLNDILDLSKIDAGKLELNEAEFELSALCASTHATFEALAAQKGLALQVEIDAAARGRYHGDAARLRQILSNLISNALKFSDRGAVRLRARRVGDALIVSVSDEGAGISPENLERLFDAFEQLGAGTAERYGGTGLGLSICRRLALLMGGEISVESRVGEGSTFHLRLQLRRLGDESAAISGPPAMPAGEALNRSLRVLVAEDNLVNQQVLRALLEPIGVDPLIVGDGAQALDAWRSGRWDLILMDVRMPVMDGLTAARAIRAEEARQGCPGIPIIALTADAMAHQIDQCAQAGMSYFMAKPIRVHDLYETMQAALATSVEAAEPTTQAQASATV